MTSEIAKAFSAAQADMHHADLDGVNPHFNSKYATLKSVIDAVKPALTKNGLSFVQTVHVSDGAVGVETIFYHESGETLTGGTVYVPTTQQSAHGYGSALTYAKRYSLATACGVSSEEDDDANVSEEKQKVVDYFVEYGRCVREHWDLITQIKECLSNADHETYPEMLSGIAADWYDLSEEDQKRLYSLAPTKGGVFSTEERKFLKEDVGKARFGDESSAS